MERFEYDPSKSRLNKERHGIDFELAQQLWNATHIIIPAKEVLGESRFLILGKLKEKVYAAVFTKRDEGNRLMSCHRADKRLERLYEKLTQAKENH